MGGSPGDVSENLVTLEKRKKGWRMSRDVGEVPESSFSNPSLALPTSQLILQPFPRFIYITVHSSTLLSLLLRSSYVTWRTAHDVIIAQLSLLNKFAILHLFPSRDASACTEFWILWNFYYIRGCRLIGISGSLIWSKTPMELIFNPCGEFRWSPEGPVSQIHSPHLLVGAPGIFSDILRFVQMLKREWDTESNGKQPHLFIPSKTTT